MNYDDCLNKLEEVKALAKKFPKETENNIIAIHNTHKSQQRSLRDAGITTDSEFIEDYYDYLVSLSVSMEEKLKEAGPISTETESTLKSVPRELLYKLPKELQIKCNARETELNHQRNIGKITDMEAVELLTEFITTTHKDFESKTKGAVPKSKQLSVEKQKKTEKKIPPLDKDEKQIHKQLNNNKLNCNVCRKLISRLITERTRYDGRKEAVEHLKSCHGIKFAFTEPISLAPPTSEAELEWTSSYQNLSFIDPVTSAQSEIGGNFPLLPPPAKTPMEIYSLTPIEADIQDSDNAEFVLPKKPLKRKASPPKENIQIRNKFQVFTDSETDTPTREINTENEGNTPSHQAPPRKQRVDRPETQSRNPTQKGTRKAKLPPPIVVQGFVGKNEYRNIQEHLLKHLTRGYHIKYTKNNVVIQAYNEEQYEQVKSILDAEKQIQWHTYATEKEKTHAFVLKGLVNEPDIQEIKDELKQAHNLEIREIYPMKTKFNLFYLVVTSANVTLKSLQNIKYLNHIEVRWEMRKRYTDIVQCRKCNKWGHTKSHCHRIPKCKNCGESHDDCEICDKPAKCANCGGDHMATDLRCVVYKYRVDKLQEQRKPPNKRATAYTEAPAPTRNIWKERREAYETRRKMTNPATSSEENTDDEGEASAYPKTRKQREKRPQTSRKENQDEPIQKSVSEILALTRDVKGLGKGLAEAVRFMHDFLSIFKETSKQERAFAFLQIMTELENYDF